MTISRSDADALIHNFDAVAGHLANAIDLSPEGAVRTMEGLDKLYSTLLSMCNAGGEVEPYIWGNVVNALQLAIARRHIHGKV